MILIELSRNPPSIMMDSCHIEGVCKQRAIFLIEAQLIKLVFSVKLHVGLSKPVVLVYSRSVGPPQAWHAIMTIAFRTLGYAANNSKAGIVQTAVIAVLPGRERR